MEHFKYSPQEAKTMERQPVRGCENSSSVSQDFLVPVEDTVCGKTDSLEIMKQFNKLYEERMSQVDSEAGGDCLQEKDKLQQKWIKNLTQQNEMLVRAVQELEYEAAKRVQQLEEKLHKNAQCLCEVMKKYREHDYIADLLAEPLQDISHYENDTKNLLEFIRRARENGNWSLNGLTFLKIPKEQLLGLTPEFTHRLSKGDSEGDKMAEDKDRSLQELTLQLNYYKSFGDVECLARELQTRREECDSLRQKMADVSQALTQEVATKHDQIVVLKRDIILLEERCLQADKQTALKETIIKELRMEIEQLKQQFTQDEVSKLNVTISELKENLERTRLMQIEEEKTHSEEISNLNETIANLEQQRNIQEKSDRDGKICKICKGRSKVGFLGSAEVQTGLGNKESEIETEKRNNEIERLKDKVDKLEASLRIGEERASNLQDAVTLYSNSVNVLEASAEEAIVEIEQQKVTIANLQQALVEAQKELDYTRKKTQENVSGSSWSAWFGLTHDVTINNHPSKDPALSNKLVHDI